ncbi:hypothetical protein [Hymenobacter sp. HDW8]|uniref:hypothetical protein n=1 Tax=Hymenobacter sp. HDW8 TaxID=2714932 RepID=UPI001409FCD7|nr:hypothetical protein [Hymenobacter sp. HDW8]QIL77659.1 hypothetical protein G7064_18805 [Hymenobacter sp. HDW8]
MAIDNQTNDELNQPNDPAKLGSDQGAGFNADDDPRAMPRSPLNAVDTSDQAGSVAPGQIGDRINAPQGSDFDTQRRQGASGFDDSLGSLGRGQGMGRAGFNGDEDRTYDESGIRGGLGSSGGREDLSDRNLGVDTNAFTGGYGGGDYNRPSDPLVDRIGMNSRNPTDESEQDQEDNSTNAGSQTT